MVTLLFYGDSASLCMQAMLKYDSASREVRLTVDRDYKAGKNSAQLAMSTLPNWPFPHCPIGYLHTAQLAMSTLPNWLFPHCPIGYFHIAQLAISSLPNSHLV